MVSTPRPASGQGREKVSGDTGKGTGEFVRDTEHAIHGLAKIGRIRGWGGGGYVSVQGAAPDPEAGPLAKTIPSDISLHVAAMGRGGGGKYIQRGECGLPNVPIWRSLVHEVVQRVRKLGAHTTP